VAVSVAVLVAVAHLTADFYKGCCQLAIYLKADLESALLSYSITLEKVCGILTNGNYWTLVLG
jgi:hypothetical protein